MMYKNRSVSSVVTSIGAEGVGFDSRTGHIGDRTQCRQRLATVATFPWSCVAQALSRSRGDGPRYTLWRNTTSIAKICL